jgi:hypothetical protein
MIKLVTACSLPSLIQQGASLIELKHACLWYMTFTHLVHMCGKSSNCAQPRLLCQHVAQWCRTR